MGRKEAIDGLDDFNSALFLRNWREMSNEAKDALFRGTGRAEYRRDLDRLARVVDTMKQYGKSANHSNTANHQAMTREINPLDRNTILGTAIGGVAYGPAGMAGALGSFIGGRAINSAWRSYQSALMTNPKTVKWLADVPKAEMRKGGLRAHLNELREMARNEVPGSALAVAIGEYLEDLQITD